MYISFFNHYVGAIYNTYKYHFDFVANLLLLVLYVVAGNSLVNMHS